MKYEGGVWQPQGSAGFEACYLPGQVFSEKYARTHPTLQIYEHAIDEVLTFEREGGRTTHGHCKMVGSGMTSLAEVDCPHRMGRSQ